MEKLVGRINYELMDTLISAVQKLVIRGVVDWIDNR